MMTRTLAASLVMVWSFAGCGGKPAPRAPAGERAMPADGAESAPVVAATESADEEDPETMPMAAAVPTGEGGALTCDRPEAMGPARVSKEAYAKRYGADVGKFSEAPTEKTRPIEACGIKASLAELARLTCDDGSSPFGGDTRKAHASRRGSMGAGGRCGSIIDAYEVGCPEANYVVHVDMYLCGPDTKWE